MSLVVGCLAGQNWHREMQRAGMNPEQRLILSLEADTDNRDEDEEVHESYCYLKDWLVSNDHLPT